MGSPAGVFQELQHNTAKDIGADSGTFAGGWGAGFQPFLSSAVKKTGCVCYRGCVAVSQCVATV